MQSESAAQLSNVDEILLKKMPKNEFDVYKQTLNQYKTASDTYAEEVLALERKFRQNTQSLTTKRSDFLKEIPSFWAIAMSKHSDLKPFLDDDDLMDFLRNYLVDLQIVFAVDEGRFGADNVKKYGKDGMVIMVEFKQNPAFSNQYITKAIGKRNINGTDVAFCEGTKIQWISEKLKTKFMGPVSDDQCSEDSDDCDIDDAEVEAFSKACGVNAGGEEDADNFFSFFSWWENGSDELDKRAGLDENGTDKFSRAIIDDLWSMPVEWYDHDDEEDSDSDDSSDDSGEDESDEEGEEML